LTIQPGDPVARFGVTYTFSLPIDYSFSFAGCAATDVVCANSWLQNTTNLNSVSTINIAGGGAVPTTGSTYNATTRTLNLVYAPGSGAWAAGDTVVFSTGWRFISAFGGNSRTLNNHTIE
jgi:hypothetical protein